VIASLRKCSRLLCVEVAVDGVQMSLGRGVHGMR
jgi:hypothetical protein